MDPYDGSSFLNDDLKKKTDDLKPEISKTQMTQRHIIQGNSVI